MYLRKFKQEEWDFVHCRTFGRANLHRLRQKKNIYRYEWWRKDSLFCLVWVGWIHLHIVLVANEFRHMQCSYRLHSSHSNWFTSNASHQRANLPRISLGYQRGTSCSWTCQKCQNQNYQSKNSRRTYEQRRQSNHPNGQTSHFLFFAQRHTLNDGADDYFRNSMHWRLH